MQPDTPAADAGGQDTPAPWRHQQQQRGGQSTAAAAYSRCCWAATARAAPPPGPPRSIIIAGLHLSCLLARRAAILSLLTRQGMPCAHPLQLSRPVSLCLTVAQKCTALPCLVQSLSAHSCFSSSLLRNLLTKPRQTVDGFTCSALMPAGGGTGYLVKCQGSGSRPTGCGC